MIKTSCFLILAAAVLVSSPAAAPANPAEPLFLTIGSGDPTGVYYHAGLTIARMINQKRTAYGIRCSVESTRGSVFNINAITAGWLELALVQSDKQHHAVFGLYEWAEKGPQEKLRSVFSLHRETINLVAAVDAGIQTLSDLKGKRVNLGNPGSGQYRNAIDTLTAAGLDPEKDVRSSKANAYEAPDLLQDNHIDAFFCTLGHPNEILVEATTGSRKVCFIPVNGPGIDQLLTVNDFYKKATIPARKFYPGAQNKADVETFSVVATLCTSSEVSTDVVYAIVSEVMDNLAQFVPQQPAFADLSRQRMLEGLTAPLHPGAIKYFRQVGLVE